MKETLFFEVWAFTKTLAIGAIVALMVFLINKLIRKIFFKEQDGRCGHLCFLMNIVVISVIVSAISASIE